MSMPVKHDNYARYCFSIKSYKFDYLMQAYMTNTDKINNNL